MTSLVATALVGIVIVAAISNALKWQKAYTLAKSAKLPVYLSPVHMTDVWWMILSPLLLPVLKRLPQKWTNPWLPMAQLFDIWKSGHKPFSDIESDTFILSTPRGNLLWTCDPSVCYQLESSYPNVQKAVEMLRFLNIYGPTVASVEGREWKAHRKVIMAGFNPLINAKVWRETIKETELLMDRWSMQDNVVNVMRDWTNRLTLHVLSTVFFRKHLTWSEQAVGTESAPEGYNMPFEQALFTILARLGVLLLTPRLLLSSLPLQRLRETNAAFVDFTKYIQVLIDDTKARLHEIRNKKDQSMLESIVIAGSVPNTLDDEPLLSEASVLGNIFFVLSAGHETAGNTMSFALNLLALYPEYQSKIQKTLDELLERRQLQAWTVESEYQTLQKGWIGAVLKETMRLYCVVQWLPRVTTAPIDITDSHGISHTVPQGTMVAMNFAAAFHNPSTWPRREISAKRRADLHNSPAVDFDPSRWFAEDNQADTDPKDQALHHFPFGQGPHVCPGRLFALVEMTAMLATILMHHSLELVVNEDLLQKCRGNKTLAREKTRDQAFRRLVDDIVSNQNIELRKELPIRLIERS